MRRLGRPFRPTTARAGQGTRPRQRLATLGVAAAALCLITSGCSGSVDKAGGAVPETVRTLKLLTPRFSVEVEPFVDELATLSASALVVQQGEQFEPGSADSEVDVIKALQAGDADLAIVPVRAFGLMGTRSFDALIAPMEIDSIRCRRRC
jgi:hypothetical protein